MSIKASDVLASVGYSSSGAASGGKSSQSSRTKAASSVTSRIEERARDKELEDRPVVEKKRVDLREAYIMNSTTTWKRLEENACLWMSRRDKFKEGDLINYIEFTVDVTPDFDTVASEQWNLFSVRCAPSVHLFPGSSLTACWQDGHCLFS
jgi:hypothetical protein